MMTGPDLAAVTAAIHQHEGLSLKPVADRRGSIVIGYGRNLTFAGISAGEADYLLSNDLTERRATLALTWPLWLRCDSPRQRVLLEMAYQLGTHGLLGFPKLLHAVAIREYERAAQEVLTSDLAAETPSRARDYADGLRS